jgi:ribosomal protein S18 acetylase RimI-like enzyme
MLIEELDKSRHNLENVKELLTMAVGNPTPEKMKQLLDDYYASDDRAIFVATQSGKIIGVIGIDCTDKPHGFITHIAVSPDMRKQGVGRHLINHTTAVLELSDIRAETDQDAVVFYRACGFETEEIESQYSGVRRFRCVKSMIESSS